MDFLREERGLFSIQSGVNVMNDRKVFQPFLSAPSGFGKLLDERHFCCFVSKVKECVVYLFLERSAV
uniref:Uncharacterized protein n=1 Tax=Cucumis melo TaxID=3656 RepID=A0A9I9EDH3_CUCME